MKTEKKETVGTIKSIGVATEERVDFIMTDKKGNDLKFTISSDVDKRLDAIRVGKEYTIAYDLDKNEMNMHEVTRIKAVMLWVKNSNLKTTNHN